LSYDEIFPGEEDKLPSFAESHLAAVKSDPEGFFLGFQDNSHDH